VIQIIRKSLHKNGYLLIIATLLYLVSLILSKYSSYSSSPARVKNELEKYVLGCEKTISNFQKDTAFIKQLLNSRIPPTVYAKYTDEKIGVFIYKLDSLKNFSLIFWNSNKMLPISRYLLQKDGTYSTTQTNGYFEFIKKTILINSDTVIFCGMIPLYWNYGINNKYLQSKFPFDNIEKRYAPNQINGPIKINNSEGKVLLSLQENEKANTTLEVLPLLLRIMGIVFFFIWLNLLSLHISKGKGWQTGFGFLFWTLFLLRFISYMLPFPFEYRNLPLFDSTIYGSNFIHPSLGDLLINTILIFWLISSVKSSAIEAVYQTKPIKGIRAWLYSIIVALILLSIAFTAAAVIRSLINDSQISFDVTNFFSLNIFSFLSFIILSFIVLSFFNISHIILLFFYKIFSAPSYARYVLVILCSLLYFMITQSGTSTFSNIFVVLWLLIYMLIMEIRRADMFIPMLRSSFFIIWLIFFAASISALIIYQNSIIIEQKRIREAEKLATEADKNAQYIFSTGIADIDSSFLLANLQNLKNQATNKAIKDSLSSRYLSINADAYDTRIYTFDENNVSLYNDDSLTIYELIKLISKGRETVAPNLFYYEKDINIFSFIYEKDLKDKDGNIKGYIFIVGDPKKYKSQSVYPELFMPGNAEVAYKSITYAIYNRGKLVESRGDYNFLSFIPINNYPKGQSESIKLEKGIEFRYNAGNGKMILTVHSQSVFLEFVTLFAYLFVSFLLIIILYQTGRLLVLFKFKVHKMRKGIEFNIKHQIQAAIVFISLFSFIIIGISTITFYINRFTQTNRERLIKSMKVLSNELGNDELKHHLFNRDTIQNNSDNDSKLQKDIKEVAEIHNVDANLYDLSGNLKATTQPDIYKKQILSHMMDPKAYYQLSTQKEVQVIQDEKMSNFSFLSIYVPLYNQSGKQYAFLNIPYLNTQQELNEEISNFLVTLINLNAFIFLIAGAFSVLLTNRITNSFSLIAEKMKKINLGSANEEIQWTSNDEIGALVNGYNKMVKKLEASAQALAKSEREDAWREMARQVAHEIKNPLTPMKLSIQYLQKAIQEKNPNTVDLSKKVTATLVEQIDQLAKIASEFSQFANITKVRKELFDINDAIKSLIDLYSTNARVAIAHKYLNEPAIINADKSQINRLFTNLFQNAIEASEDRNTANITIEVKKINHNLLISFGDEGGGIPKEKQDKIFTPNFTTKSSGTGLGLAISKGIVENASGKIWFDTEEGKGTTFFILLPVVE
jgi:two-component system, NtrC family, nitrogen regulation sensor histidine kinase NtrY